MARKRMMSPEMFTSRTVSRWAPATRWTWAGLICYLDNYGYGDDSAALVKASVWPDDEAHPYATVDVAADLARFVEDESLCRFECCGKPLIHVPKWFDWQTVAHPGIPRFCVCPTHSRSSHEEHRKVSRKRHETFRLNEVSSNESKVSDVDGPDLTPSGSVPSNPARTVLEALKQKKDNEALPSAETA